MDTPSQYRSSDYVPRAATLDAWAEDEWTRGIQLRQMKELETLVVRTVNSVYEIAILRPAAGEVLVRGGNYFPEWTPAILTGCTMGGTILKQGGIYLGMRIEFVPEPVQMVSSERIDPVTGRKEFLLGHQVISTSPVESIGALI